MSRRSTVRRIAALGALGATVAVIAPVAGASAAPGVSGQVIVGPAVVGPVVTTTAPSSFINTNNQGAVGGNVTGVQVSGP
jgi:hypothetical protein